MGLILARYKFSLDTIKRQKLILYFVVGNYMHTQMAKAILAYKFRAVEYADTAFILRSSDIIHPKTPTYAN